MIHAAEDQRTLNDKLREVGSGFLYVIEFGKRYKYDTNKYMMCTHPAQSVRETKRMILTLTMVRPNLIHVCVAGSCLVTLLQQLSFTRPDKLTMDTYMAL